MWLRFEIGHSVQTWPSMVKTNVIFCWGGAGTGLFFFPGVEHG